MAWRKEKNEEFSFFYFFFLKEVKITQKKTYISKGEKMFHESESILAVYILVKYDLEKNLPRFQSPKQRRCFDYYYFY